MFMWLFIQWIFFIFSAAIFILLFVDEFKVEKIIRSIGFLLSALIVFAYHLNWLPGLPLTIFGSGMFLILSAGLLFIIRRMRGVALFSGMVVIKSQRLKKILLGFTKQLIVPMLLVLVVMVYFKGDLNSPRYYTADAGQHYLQMTQTAKTGSMRQFLPTDDILLSAVDEAYKHPFVTFFPGATVPFFFLHNFLHPVNSAISFQLFNLIFYVLVVSYLYFLAVKHGMILGKFWRVFLLILLALGVVFNFLITSYTTQLFGLFILIFFSDAFDAFYRREMSFVPAAIGFAALFMSYIYWVPVALLLVGVYICVGLFERLKDGPRNKMENFPFKSLLCFGVLSFVLSVGFLASMLRVKLFGFAAADGGFSLALPMLSDPVMIMPLSCVGFWIVWRKRNEQPLISFLSIAIFSYAGILYFFYRFTENIVSNYARLKVLYLAVPLAWVLAVIALEKISVYVAANRKQWKLAIAQPGNRGIYVAVVIGFFLMIGNILLDNKPRLLPVMVRNVDFIKGSVAEANLSVEQMQLLNLVKKDYQWVLQGGKIFVVAPYDTALWVFAYAGIWPRTETLVRSEKTYKDDMSLNSPNIAEYATWLKQDREHILIYFDDSSGRKWVKNNNFNFEDYEVLASVGRNKLLRLKPDSEVEWMYASNDPEKKLRKKISLPYEETLHPKENSLRGLVFALSVSNHAATVDDKYRLSIFYGNCNNNGQVIFKKEVSIDEIRDISETDAYTVLFDKPITGYAEEGLCMRWSVITGRGNSLRLMSSKNADELVLQEIYAYKNGN